MKTLVARLLVNHRTYSSQDIENLEELKRRVKCEGSSSLDFNDSIRLINYLTLTSIVFDEFKRRLDPTSEFVEIAIDNNLCKLFGSIKKNLDNRDDLSQIVGYFFASAGSPDPLLIGEKFSLSEKDKYIDVGCGFSTKSLRVVSEAGCETYLLDPNVVNIRLLYQRLLSTKLIGNPKVKIVLSTIQDFDKKRIILIELI